MMKVAITFTDADEARVDELLSAARVIIDEPLKVKRTPPKDGYNHLYIATKSCKNAGFMV